MADLLYSFIAGTFLFYSFYFAFFSVAGSIPLRIKKGNLAKGYFEKNTVVVFPAYNPNQRLIESVKAALQLPEKPLIFVLLQKAAPEIRQQLAILPGVFMLEKDFSQTTGNSYHAALRYLSSWVKERCQKEGYQLRHLLLLDKDNLVAPDFLASVQQHGRKEFTIWQGQRRPIGSPNNHWAKADALSELLNDCLMRQGKNALGLSAELSGSAVVFPFPAFERAVCQLDKRAPGMDKNLLIQLLKDKNKVQFLPQAYVSEEKTEKASSYGMQRSRWFGNQYFNAWHYSIGLWKLKTIHAADYALSLWRLPRMVQIALSPLLALAEIAVQQQAGLWCAALGLNIAGVVFFLSGTKKWPQFLGILCLLPKLTLSNLKSIWQFKYTLGRFVHTPR